MLEPALPTRRELHLFRLYYFLSIGADGFLLPFLSLFFRRQGLSGAAIGLLGTISAGAGLLAAPVWGRWSDHFRRPRSLIQTALVVSAAIGLILGRQDHFVWIAILWGASALVSAGVSPLSDNLASGIVDRMPDVGFGSIRLWGSLGWTVVTVPAGRLIELFGIYVAFVGRALGAVVSALVVHWLPAEGQGPEIGEGEETAGGGNILQVIAAIRQNPLMVNLAAGLCCLWLLSSGLQQFEAIYLDELGAGESLIGLANALHAAVELPAMLWADRLIRRFSAGWLLRLSLLIQGLRMAAILLFPVVGVIMAVRVLVGLQFSFFNVSVVGYISRHSHKAARATSLALITITLRNLAVMVGNPLSGLIYDAVGAYWLYGLGLFGALGGWAMLQWRRKPAPSGAA